MPTECSRRHFACSLQSCAASFAHMPCGFQPNTNDRSICVAVCVAVSVAITMRNPCDLYISLAHYGGAKGHTGRPWWPNWYGGDWASKATNPVPDINYTVWPPQIGTPGADIRRNVPVAMMEAYVYAARRAASGVGWYSFMLWEQVVAGECLFSQFVDKHGKEHTFNRTEKGSTLWKACYGDPARVKRYTHALTLHVSSGTRML